MADAQGDFYRVEATLGVALDQSNREPRLGIGEDLVVFLLLTFAIDTDGQAHELDG